MGNLDNENLIRINTLGREFFTRNELKVPLPLSCWVMTLVNFSGVRIAGYNCTFHSNEMFPASCKTSVFLPANFNVLIHAAH